MYNSINRQFISFFYHAHKKGKQNPLAVPFCRKGSHSHWHMLHMASVWDLTPIRPITTIQLDFPISVQWKYQMLVAYCPIFTVQSDTKKHVTKLYIQTIVLYHLYLKKFRPFSTLVIFLCIYYRGHTWVSRSDKDPAETTQRTKETQVTRDNVKSNKFISSTTPRQTMATEIILEI